MEPGKTNNIIIYIKGRKKKYNSVLIVKHKKIEIYSYAGTRIYLWQGQNNEEIDKKISTEIITGNQFRVID